jgi:adenylosuccinate synthase
LDVEVLFSEIDQLRYPPERIFISPFASVITEQHKAWEQEAGLTSTIGSTGAGVGAAVLAAAARRARNFPLKALHADDHGRLQSFVRETSTLLHDNLLRGRRVVIEGSQGFGLSLLEGGHWPKATARSTTAAAALAEAGLSPRYVDDVTMVLRSYPIRVAGDSGPLVGETTWDEIARRSGRKDDLREYTTVTKRERRVGEFDAELVKRAFIVNSPHRLVLNHLDYVGEKASLVVPDSRVRRFVDWVEAQIGTRVDWFGFSGVTVTERGEVFT